MTVKSKKRKLARARAHAERRDNRGAVSTKAKVRVVLPSLDGPFSGFTAAPTSDEVGYVHADTELVAQEPPSRTKCPSCGFSQKVRKDGTMSRHDVFVGSNPSQCPGTGRPWTGLARA